MSHENTNIVRVRRNDLVQVLKDNKNKHVKEYEIAKAQFQKDVVEETREMLKKNEAGNITLTLRNNIMIPTSFEKEYDKALRKYEMSMDDDILLDDVQFTMYVMDEWHWKGNLSNAFYASKGM